MTDLAAFQHFRSRKSQPVLFRFISRVTSSVSIRQSAERGNRKVVGTFDTNRAVIVAVPNCHRWRSDNLDNSFFRVHLMAQKLMICVFFFCVCVSDFFLDPFLWLSDSKVYRDRDQFASLVREVAAPDVGRMGIEILSFTIKGKLIIGSGFSILFWHVEIDNRCSPIYLRWIDPRKCVK